MATEKSHSKVKNGIQISRVRLSVPQLLIAVLVIGVIGSVVIYRSFAATGSLSLTPASGTGSIGSNITVTINENSGTDPVNAVEADLTYPTAQLQFISSDVSTSGFPTTAQNSGGSGVVTIALGSTTPVTGSQTVVVVTFKVLAAGSATIGFGTSDVILQSSDNTNILTTKTGATFTLSDATAPTAPGTPSAATTGLNSIGLTWAAATDNVAVTSYRIYRGGSQVGTSATTNYTDTGLTPGTGYSYTVAALDAAGNLSTQSSAATLSTAPDTAAPSVPAGLTAVLSGASTVNLSWTASTDNVAVTGYRVFRGATQIATVSGTTTTYSDTNLAAGTYSYTVKAADAVPNISAASTAASVTIYAAGDINHSGHVDITDLSVLLSNWGRTGVNTADLNGDSTVNITDLSILLSHYGQ